MTSLQQSHRAMARQPWRELEHPRTLDLFSFWQQLPDLLDARPFGELSGRIPVSETAADCAVAEMHGERSGLAKSGDAGRASKSDSSPAKSTPKSTHSVQRDRDRNTSTRARKPTAGTSAGLPKVPNEQTYEDKQDRRRLAMSATSEGESTVCEPPPESLDVTRVIYDLAARRVVGSEHRDTEQRTQPETKKRSVKVLPDKLKTDSAKNANDARTTRADRVHHDGTEDTLSAIRTSLARHAAPSSLASDERPLDANDEAIASPDAESHGRPVPTPQAEPAKADQTAATENSREGLGEHLLELINDALVNEARRHGVDI